MKSNTTPAQFTTDQREIFTGLMLGDGSLHKTKKIDTQNASLIVERSSRDFDYLMDNFNAFKDFCLSKPRSYERIQTSNGSEKLNHYTKFSTRSLPLISNYW